MELLRGGKLAKLLPEYEAGLNELRPDEEIPAWAFRFLQSIPSVTMILSGMSLLCKPLPAGAEYPRPAGPLQ